MSKALSGFDGKIKIAATAIVFFGWAQQSAIGQQVVKPLDRPDPASITVPDLAFTPTSFDNRNYDVYYYFNKTGVSYETAFADLDQCRLYTLESQLAAIPPTFVPLGSDVITASNRAQIPNFFAQYGVLGMLIAGVIVDAEAKEDARATEKRCMAYKGYSRYGTSNKILDKINAGSDAEKLARMALIASGPQPTTQAIDP